MNLRDVLRIPSADVTEESVYRDRRRVLAMLGAHVKPRHHEQAETALKRVRDEAET